MLGTLGDVHELERLASEFNMAFGDTPVEDVCVLGSPVVSRARFGRSREDGTGTVDVSFTGRSPRIVSGL